MSQNLVLQPNETDINNSNVSEIKEMCKAKIIACGHRVNPGTLSIILDFMPFGMEMPKPQTFLTNEDNNGAFWKALDKQYKSMDTEDKMDRAVDTALAFCWSLYETSGDPMPTIA